MPILLLLTTTTNTKYLLRVASLAVSDTGNLYMWGQNDSHVISPAYPTSHIFFHPVLITRHVKFAVAGSWHVIIGLSYGTGMF